MGKEIILGILLGVGYAAAIPVAGFPVYPMLMEGLVFAVLATGNVQNKSITLFISGLALLGYYTATVLADFPTWPLVIASIGLVAICLINVMRARVAAGGAS